MTALTITSRAEILFYLPNTPTIISISSTIYFVCQKLKTVPVRIGWVKFYKIMGVLSRVVSTRCSTLVAYIGYQIIRSKLKSQRLMTAVILAQCLIRIISQCLYHGKHEFQNVPFVLLIAWYISWIC